VLHYQHCAKLRTVGCNTTILMTRTLLQTLMFLILCSCGQINKTSPDQKDTTRLLKLKSRFKHHNLTDFATDTMTWETRPRNYQEVDSVAFKLIFQEGDRQFIGHGYDRDYFFSWQERDSNFIEFTILTQDESSYCDLLRYYIFDKNGRFISKFDIATKCGDAGWTFKGSGRQTSNNQFTYETVESDLQDGELPEAEKYEIDSINYLITITATGQISKIETFKKHFSD